MHARKKPPPLPTSAPPSSVAPQSGTRPKVTGVLRLAPTRPGLMFDEVLVFPNGVTLIAIEGEPLLRYANLEAMLQAHALEPHELRAYPAYEHA